METLKVLKKCELCEKSGEDLSLLSANHKERGWINVCRECWVELYAGNHLVAGSGGSKGTSSSPCSSCPGCCY